MREGKTLDLDINFKYRGNLEGICGNPEEIPLDENSIRSIGYLLNLYLIVHTQ